MQKDTLQIDPWTSWDFERNLQTFEAEDGNANESVRGTVKNSNLTNDGAEVCKMRGAFSLAITELDPLRNFPSVSSETEMSNRRRIRDWKITATIDGSIVFK
jgi:hypothetical protein